MNTTELIRDFSSLPPEAQREVFDFVAFLKSRYPITPAQPSKKPGILAEEPFIGMWKDREDMQDSTDWVRDQRRKEWNLKS